ncbi:unnamed protein product [Brassica oleracea]
MSLHGWGCSLWEEVVHIAPSSPVFVSGKRSKLWIQAFFSMVSLMVKFRWRKLMSPGRDECSRGGVESCVALRPG